MVAEARTGEKRNPTSPFFDSSAGISIRRQQSPLSRSPSSSRTNNDIEKNHRQPFLHRARGRKVPSHVCAMIDARSSPPGSAICIGDEHRFSPFYLLYRIPPSPFFISTCNGRLYTSLSFFLSFFFFTKTPSTCAPRSRIRVS